MCKWCSTLVVVAAVVVLAPALPRAQSTADLFNADVLQRVDLWLHDSDWEKLKQNFRENTYYPAEFVWNGQTTPNTGIRSRGFGSRSGSKPGLRVDFNEYIDRQEFLGLKSVILDNLTQDHSTLRETTTMRMFARLGIPAPREAHTRLYVNGRYVGLYALVESIDKAFLARVFGSIGDDVQNDGYLFEYKYQLGNPWRFEYLGSDLDPYKTRFEAKTRENESDHNKWRPIETLVRLANDLPSDQYLDRLGEHLDLRAFVRYVAAQNFMGQNDGFLGYDGMNNFYLYRLENQSRHVFLAWDEDLAFWGAELPVEERHQENVLMRKAMEVAELRDLYYATLREAANIADTPLAGRETPWLEEEVRRQLDLVEGALAEDPVKPYSMDDFETARAHVINFSRDRGRYVMSNVPR